MKKSSMYQEILDQYEVAKAALENRWDEAVKINDILKNANQIIFMGTGASLNACYGVKAASIKYLKKIPAIVEMADAQAILPAITDKTVCFLVSQSGESKETVEGIDIMCGTKALTIAVTNEKESYLASKSDITLELKAGKEISSATKTCTASILIMCMAVCCHDELAVSQLKELPGLIEKALSELPGKVSEIAEMLRNEKAFYIGALGALYPAARQGALLIKEKDFILSEGLSISELRHGTVEAVYENMPVFIVAANEDNHKAQEHARYFANHVKAKTFLITNKKDALQYGNIACIKIENSENDCFTGICPTIFFQFLSENIAEINGYDVDGFRYLSKVIETY